MRCRSHIFVWDTTVSFNLQHHENANEAAHYSTQLMLLILPWYYSQSSSVRGSPAAMEASLSISFVNSDLLSRHIYKSNI